MMEGWEELAHALRREAPCMLLVKDFRHATVATNVLDHQADIAKVQEWLGHANMR
jgi:site-specific recombinase XerD